MQLAKFDEKLQNMTIVTSYDEATPFSTSVTAQSIAYRYLNMSAVKHDGKFYCAIPSETRQCTISEYCSTHPDKPYLPRYIQRLIAKNQRELLRANWNIIDWQVFGKTIVLTVEK